MIKPSIALLTVVLCGAVPLGCSSTSGGAARIDNSTATMASTEDVIRRGESQLNSLVTSLTSMERSDDLNRSYRDYDRGVRRLESTAQALLEHRVTLQTQATEHTTRWRTESAQLSGDRAQDVSEERRRAYADSVNEVGDELEDLHAEYEPLLTRLRDLNTVLSNDLTRQGVDATRDMRRDIIEMADDLRDLSAETRENIREARLGFTR